MPSRYYQGLFKPKHPGKYRGDPSNIVYRSSWECRLMSHFDVHPDVLWWSSEEIIIRYRSPVDGRLHRYFPDFLVHLKTKTGGRETVMIEVKPKNQTRPPERANKRDKRYIKEVVTWGTNEAKWAAAREYCDDRKWRFEIMTEEHIFGTTAK